MHGKSKARARLSQLQVPEEWTFKTPEIARAFDSHVREQLPWYDMATGAVAHVARCFIPQDGVVLDVGCSTGNISRALRKSLVARNARYIGIDSSSEMVSAFLDANGPFTTTYVCDVRAYDFWGPRLDLIVCFLSLMFVPPKDREIVISRMKQSLQPGGAIVVVDKVVPRGGYIGTVNYRLTLAAKYEAGATPQEIIRKELSIAGLQRPLAESELDGFVEFFRFGDFAGYVWEKV